MTELTRYVGGEFSATDNDEFLQGEFHSSFQKYFPETKRGKQLSFFQTGTDALAHQLNEIYIERNQKLNIWFPNNYCQATINRLLSKLQFNKVENNIFRYDETKEQIHANSSSVVILMHFNCYDAKIQKQFAQLENNGAIMIEDFVHAPFEISNFSFQFAFCYFFY